MITLFGIKNCDTVKKARRWLEAQSIEYQFHDFRVDGINNKQVSTWVEALGTDQLINKRSTTWKGLAETDKESLTPASAIKLVLDNPTLIKRPLLYIESQKTGDDRESFYVGFKDKTYQDIFNTL